MSHSLHFSVKSNSMSLNKSKELTDNTTDVSSDITLKDLNDEVAEIYYGADILFGILILPGVIGNIHVLQIYILKKPASNTRVYVCFLAIIDLLACGASMPFSIYNCLLPYMFYNDFACKLGIFLNGFVTLGSAISLLVITIERYRKICTPFKPQVTIKYAKLSCVLVVIVTCIFNLPIPFLYGSTRIPTVHPDFYGYECFVHYELRATNYPTIYNGGILLLTVSLCTIMIILYTLIGIHLWRQQKKMNRSKSKKYTSTDNQPSTQTEISSTAVSDSQTSSHHSSNKDSPETPEPLEHGTKPKLDTTTVSKDMRPNEGILNRSSTQIGSASKHSCSTSKETGHPTTSNNKGSKPGQKITRQKSTVRDKLDQAKRTTYMFFLITLFYLFSYIPYPILRLYQVLNIDWYLGLSLPGLITFHTALGSLYINNVVNSFIYTVCDRQYRQELKKFYATLFCRN